MASANAIVPAVVKPAEVALQQLVTHLRCYVCTKFPKNTHICPSCSEMYCYVCVYRMVTTGWNKRNKCGKCRASLRLDQLIKLRCFETLDDISGDFARLSLNHASKSPPVAAASPGGSGAPASGPAINSGIVEFAAETKRIPVGRQEPVQGLPPAVRGTFTLRNVHQCRLPWVFSERIVDEMGFLWRLRVCPKGENQQASPMMDVYVEMLHGEPGFFEIMLELTNFAPRAYLVLDHVDTETLVGQTMFLENNLLPRGNVNLQFRYTIRPASYKAKVLLQQRLLHKHELQLETMKGNCDTFIYCIDNYQDADLQDEAFEEFTDQLESVWRVGVHGKHSFTEFVLILDSGLPGIYSVSLILTHPTATSEKRLHYAKRNIQINQKNLFNFGVRWSELDERGFMDYDDTVTVKITVRPLQVDLKRVQQELADGDDDDDDDDDDDEDEYDDDDDYEDEDDNEYDYEETESDDDQEYANNNFYFYY